jgi:hypothetical protein
LLKNDVIDDPEEVIVDFRESKISDMSALMRYIN